MSQPSVPPMSEFMLTHNEAERMLQSLVQKELNRVTLTKKEWLALSVVAAGPREGVRMSEMAKRLGLALPQCTPLVATLMERKLCKQHIAEHDRRGRHLQATLKGRRLLGNLDLDMQLALEEATASIENAQLTAYVAVNKQLADRIAAVAAQQLAPEENASPENEVEPSKHSLSHRIPWKEI